MPSACKIVCFNEEKIGTLRTTLENSDQLESLARIHRALANPGRLAILHLLAIEECCVCDLANILGQPTSTISQNLGMLKNADLVKSRQDGKLIFYSLTRSEFFPAIEGSRIAGESISAMGQKVS